MSEHGPDLPRDLAAELRLRPERPPVTRLSRRVLMALVALRNSLCVRRADLGALPRAKKVHWRTELYSTENKPTPDGLSALPRDYTGLPPNGVPALGPPLLGDIGRPIPAVQSRDRAQSSTLSNSASCRKQRPPALAVCSPRLMQLNAR